MRPSGSPPYGSTRPAPPITRGPISSPSSASSTTCAATGDRNGSWSRTCSPAPSPNSAAEPAGEPDDHQAYYPGSHRIAMRVIGDRATGRLLEMQLFGQRTPRSPSASTSPPPRSSTAYIAAVSDLNLSYTPPLRSP